jgi:hypothetical protein
LRAFAFGESGAVATDWAFMTAASLGCALAVITTVSRGPEDLSLSLVEQLTEGEITYRSFNFGRNRLEVLLEGPIETFSDQQVQIRYDRFTDAAQRTEAQVRNAHRTWMRRLEDPTYSNPGRARDMVRILEAAMDLRSITPHDNI